MTQLTVYCINAITYDISYFNVYLSVLDDDDDDDDDHDDDDGDDDKDGDELLLWYG